LAPGGSSVSERDESGVPKSLRRNGKEVTRVLWQIMCFYLFGPNCLLCEEEIRLLKSFATTSRQNNATFSEEKIMQKMNGILSINIIGMRTFYTFRGLRFLNFKNVQIYNNESFRCCN
jgi:hypothetical protein